jgi:hypothetical protein
MKKMKKLLVVCLVLAAAGMVQAVTLVDNFNGYSTGVIGPTPGVASPPWTVSTSVAIPPGPASVSAITGPDTYGNCLSYGVPLALPADETFGVSRALNAPIATWETMTLFCRFNADPLNANNSFGLTTAVTPGAANFNNFNIQMAARNGKFSVRNGGSFIETVYPANTWMDVWAVIHPTVTAGNVDFYMKVDDGLPATALNLIKAGATYRNALGSVNTPGYTLSFFDCLVQGAAGTPALNLTIKLDDIHVSPGVCLTPEPATLALLGLGGLFLRRRSK